MMNISNIRDWFKTIAPGFTEYYVGRLNDTKREKLMSFKRGVVPPQQKAIGGMGNTSYSRIACNTIIHWSKDSNESDIKATEIYETLLNTENYPVIGLFKVVSITIRNFVDIGIDENKIHEYALDFEVLYKR